MDPVCRSPSSGSGSSMESSRRSRRPRSPGRFCRSRCGSSVPGGRHSPDPEPFRPPPKLLQRSPPMIPDDRNEELPLVLIIDDDPSFCADVEALLLPEYRVRSAASGAPGLRILQDEGPIAVILDLFLEKGENGLFVLSDIIERSPYIPVVIATDHASPETRTEALERKAAFFVEKAAGRGELIAVLRKCIESAQQRRAADYSRKKEEEAERDGFIASSPAMRELSAKLERVAASAHAPVLLLGESGTGKNRVAREIHQRGPRSGGPFVEVLMAGVTESLIESQLFGHMKGAFTGATSSQPGWFEVAQGGTIFLDEIGDAPPCVQKRLLTAIEERKITRVGANHPRLVDVRVIAATAKDLDAMVRNDTFRNDLRGRLDALRLTVPPLRERKEEIPALTRLFVETVAKENRIPEPKVSDEAIAFLQRHRWGQNNVRELRNAITAALILHAHGGILLPEHFELRGEEKKDETDSLDYKQERDRLLRRFQWDFFERAFESVGGSLEKPTTAEIRAVAELTGITEQALRRIRHELLGGDEQGTAIGP
ncbi:MAG: response regulator [Candidatus Eisenbacteria bacterium]|nr:response regulator [Candidatus Latescibacterota bacterium]MBD3302574.1 response regulator [Candidatus Eisenbacteria bacterium]